MTNQNLEKVVLDTNIFVSASFNKKSNSHKIFELIKNNKVQFIWNPDTKDETKYILKKIPVIKWDRFKDIFKPEYEFTKKVTDKKFTEIQDHSDRKFANLAYASTAVLITSDQHFLNVRSQLPVKVLTSSEYIKKFYNN